MNRVGYSEHQIQVVGDVDLVNFQGVANPHKWADLQAGNRVADLGSGLGLDSVIAADAVGVNGFVTGIDISSGEVQHANRRAEERHIKNVNFVHGDLEQIPLDSNSVDRVISNGAFCLAPNKVKSFSEVFRILKPGGKFSIACTTLLKPLDANTKWPVCIKVFMPLNQVESILNQCGFSEFNIDKSDTNMTLEVDGEYENDKRQGIHNMLKEFEHLKDIDMNSLCARIVIHGVK